MSKPITLVLGGRGVKGVASIGILQSFNNHNIQIKKIIAAGISSLVSVQFALGNDPSDIIDEFTNFFEKNNRSLWGLEQFTGLLMSRRRRILESFSYFLRERLYCQASFEHESILSWELIEPQITKFFGNKTFSDLNIPLAVSAIDLKQGRQILLNSGKLDTAMKASIAFPGLFPPVSIGNMALISSTIFCELPLNKITKKDSPIVAIDLPSYVSGHNLRSVLEILSRVDDIRSEAIKEKMLAKTDYLFQFEGMKRFRWGNYRQIPQIVTQARKETDRMLNTIMLP